MAGFWQNQQGLMGNSSSNNLNVLINQALLGGSGQQVFGNQPLNPALYGNNNDNGTAHALLVGSGLPNQGSYVPLSNSTVTKSTITLPASLAKQQRQGGATMSDSELQRNSNSASTSSQSTVKMSKSQFPMTSNNFTSQSNFLSQNRASVANVVSTSVSSPPENVDTSNPVFSTGMRKGKQLSVVKVTPPSRPNPPRVEAPVPLILDPTNTQQKMVPFTHHRPCYDNDCWHKISVCEGMVHIVGGASMDKEKVLKRILEACEPSLVLPVTYHCEGEDAVFYARSCGTGIERLCKRSLTLECDGKVFGLRIHLQYAPSYKLHINVLNLLHRVVEKRWKEDEACLDLTDFQHDSDLEPYVYCPLSQPAVLHYVLLTAITHPINFVKLRLSHNGIRQFKVEVLLKAVHFRILDLSHNELLYRVDLKGLKDLRNVTGLALDGNPVCAEFRTPEDYIGFLKSLMPQLKSLDGVPLFCGTMVMAKEQNFLCSRSGYQLVDQFLKHFFDRYDWSDRRSLDGMYHKDAVFTLTCSQVGGQSASESTNLAFYKSYSRNLKKLSDYSKADKLFYHGPTAILDLFCELPASEHDPFSFSVDLIYYNEKQAVISVNGVFRELPSLPLDPKLMLSFHRVFILSCVASNEWQVTNEKLHISNLTIQQAEAAFKKKRPPIEPPVAAWLVQDAELLSIEEKDQMTHIMVQLTTLNQKWATRYLAENHWYMREALIAFVNEYEANVIPNDAFLKKVSS